MTDTDQQAIRADVLARLLLVQSAAGHLPDEAAIVSFVCRGLQMVPGVARAWLSERGSPDSDDTVNLAHFPLSYGGTALGEINLELGEPASFAPYSPHVHNLIFIVAVMLEERRQRRLTEAHQYELEQRVEERTRQLTQEIHERRAAEASALAEKRRAEDYLEIAEAIIVELDSAGKISVINKRGCDLLGRSATDLHGQDWFELAVPPEERGTVRNVFERLIEGKDAPAEYYDSPILTRTGKLIHVAWHNVPRFNQGRVIGILSSGVDITERKYAEQALASEKERLSVTLSSIGDGVITTDTNGRVAIMNPVAEMLTGWRQDEAEGHSLAEVFAIIDERTLAPCDNPVTRVLSTGSAIELSNHTLLIARDGTRRAIADSGAPIRDPQGNVFGVVLVFRDVTEKQRLMEQMQRAERLDAIGVLAGGIAHDFNNLLGGIFGYMSMAREQVRDDDAAQCIESLDEALKVFERARDLTQQLLTFSKGGYPIRSVVDLRKLIADCSRFALSGSNVSRRIHLSPELPSVEVDSNQIWRVLDNLIRNAIQAMPHGGELVVRGEVVDIAAPGLNSLASRQYAKISIIDNGVGIAPEILPKIFDPFFTTKERGSGLGLATAYSIVKKHDGHIEVESELGQGSGFHIYLPSAQSSATSASSSQAVVVHEGKGRALVMDDEQYLRMLFARYLARMGYENTLVRDGDEAITAVKEALATGRPFSVALLDLTVPGGMGGKEAIQRIRELCPQLVAIASSGYSDDPVMARPQEFGFSASLPKPFVITDLAAALEAGGSVRFGSGAGRSDSDSSK